MTLIAVLSALIILATIIARGADHPTHARASGPLPWIRLQVEKVSLLLVGVAAGGVVFSALGGVEPSLQTTALATGTALWVLTHPGGWWRYVVRGRAPACEEARADP